MQKILLSAMLLLSVSLVGCGPPKVYTVMSEPVSYGDGTQIAHVLGSSKDPMGRNIATMATVKYHPDCGAQIVSEIGSEGPGIAVVATGAAFQGAIGLIGGAALLRPDRNIVNAANSGSEIEIENISDSQSMAKSFLNNGDP